MLTSLIVKELHVKQQYCNLLFQQVLSILLQAFNWKTVITQTKSKLEMCKKKVQECTNLNSRAKFHI